MAWGVVLYNCLQGRAVLAQPRELACNGSIRRYTGGWGQRAPR